MLIVKSQMKIAFSILLNFLPYCFLCSMFSLFSSPVFADGCKPVTQIPSIYQINRTSTQATLFITPISDPVISYSIAYGFQSGDERFGTTFNYGQSSGAISYTINNLDSTKHYYFKVRANNICSNGPWSVWVGDNSNAVGTTIQSNKLPATGSDDILFGVSIGLVMLFSGLILSYYNKLYYLLTK